jgi:adenylate cyclase
MSKTRCLAAISAADLIGYSRLMGADEEGTLARLQALRSAVIDPAVTTSGGRIVKSTGDGILVEFPSAVEAARCALDMPTEMRKIHDRDGQ